MMAFKVEDVTVWIIASINKYLYGYPFGVPVVVNQQARERDNTKKDWLEVNLIGPNFSEYGTKNELLGQMSIEVFINTTYVPTDIYHHLRLKAKVADALVQNIPILRLGTPQADKAIVGYLCPIKTELLTVTPVSVEEPDGSIATKTYSIDLC
jgi:hypothetical protein